MQNNIKCHEINFLNLMIKNQWFELGSAISDKATRILLLYLTLGVVHKWRHGLRGRGFWILWRQSLSNKTRDDGEGGQKLLDVIYGRTPSQL